MYQSESQINLVEDDANLVSKGQTQIEDCAEV